MAFDMGMGMLGLGLASDAFGAYSAMQQQQRQRDLYKKQLELSQRLQDPRAMVAGSQPYVDALNANLNKQIPNIMRSDVAPMLGMRGIDPGSGQGQLILNQALAPYYAQNAQMGLQNYMQSLQGGMGALSGAGMNAGQAMGGGGGTMQALQAMMMMNALRGGGGRGTAVSPDPVYSGQGNPASPYGMQGQAQSLSYLNPSFGSLPMASGADVSGGF